MSACKKWAKLEAILKEVADHNNKTGNSHKKWKYYSEIADCIDMNAAARPTYTLESSSCVMSNEGEESDSSADGDYLTETLQKKTPRKRPAKKRKIMEEMNEDKKLFWPNLLQALKIS